MTIELTVLIAVVGCICTLGSFFGTRFAKSKSDGEQNGALRKELEHIGEKLTKLETKFDLVTDRNHEMGLKVAVIERDLKTAFGKIDDLENHVHGRKI